MKYITVEQIDRFISDMTSEGLPTPTYADMESIFNEMEGTGNWKIVSSTGNTTTLEEALNSANSKNNNSTTTTIETTNNSTNSSTNNNTSNTSTTNNNTSIVDNTKTDSTNTINGTTTEEQKPVTETPKEGYTINISDKEETQSPSENISDSNIENRDLSKPLYDRYITSLNKTFGEDKVKELVKAAEDKTGQTIDNTSGEGLKEVIEYLSKNEGKINDISGDINAVYEYYKQSGEDEDTFWDNLSTGKYTDLLLKDAVLAMPLLKWLKKAGGFKKIGKFFNKISKKFAKSSAGKAIKANGWGPILWTILAGAENIFDDRHGSSRSYDNEGNLIDTNYRDMFTKGKAGEAWKNFAKRLGISTANELDNLLLGLPGLIWDLADDSEEYGGRGVAPRKNSEKEQRRFLNEKHALKDYQNSGTYKTLKQLNKLPKEEQELATSQLYTASAVLNYYGATVNPEYLFQNFVYDTDTHTRYNKEDGVSLFNTMKAYSDSDALAAYNSGNE